LRDDRIVGEKLSCFYALEQSPLVVVTYQVGCMDIRCRFPCIVTFRVPFPLDQILKGPVSPRVPMIPDLLHFILRFITDQVQRRSGEVRPVCSRFAIGQ